MEDRTGIGGNAPPPPSPLTLPQIREFLDFQHADLVRRRDVLLAALKDMTRDVQQIEDDEVLAAVSSNMSLVDHLRTRAEAARKSAKEPFWEGGKTVDGWFKILLKDTDALMTTLQQRCDTYVRAKVEARRQAELAEARRLQAEAEQRAAEAQAALRSRTAAPEAAGEALDRAAEAADQAAQAAERADAKPAEAARLYTDTGVTVSVKRTWKWRLVDIRKVPHDFLAVDEAKVKEAARNRDRDTGRPITEIPGIEWYSEDTTIRR